jgi:hypothetical protein
MSIDRRTFLKTGIGAAVAATLRVTGRFVAQRIVPVVARTVPRMRINLLRFWP